MKWKSIDYDCYNVFVNTILGELEEPNKYGFSHFFSLIDEYLEIPGKLSPKIVRILLKAKTIDQKLPIEKLTIEIKKVYDDFKSLEM